MRLEVGMTPNVFQSGKNQFLPLDNGKNRFLPFENGKNWFLPRICDQSGKNCGKNQVLATFLCKNWQEPWPEPCLNYIGLFKPVYINTLFSELGSLYFVVFALYVI